MNIYSLLKWLFFTLFYIQIQIHGIFCALCCNETGVHVSVCPLNNTEDGIPSGRVTTKGEDVGVVSSDHSESVRLFGQLCCTLNCFIKHHSFRQSQFGNAIVMAVINSPS